MATYQSISYVYFATNIQVNGKTVRITFKEGFTQPYKYNGTFTTPDPDIIKALESDRGFNSLYKRLDPDPVADERIPVKPAIPIAPKAKTNTDQAASAKTGATDDPPVGDTDPKDLIPVIGITSFQQAKNYFLATFPELKSADLKSIELVKQFAAEKGIIFTDWV